MARDGVMPQVGESIAEGTIVRWIKKVGDSIDRDEPLFEISTDKVDAEIPSPAAGVLTEIKVKEGETVPVNEVVAMIGEAGAAAATPPETPPAQASPPTVVAISDAQKRSSASRPPASARPAAQAPPAPSERIESRGHDEERHVRSSPLVRRIAREHNVDVAAIHGSGLGGRVTKNDILGYIGNRQAAPVPPTPSAAPDGAESPIPAVQPGSLKPASPTGPLPDSRLPIPVSPGDRVEPLSV